MWCVVVYWITGSSSTLHPTLQRSTHTAVQEASAWRRPLNRPSQKGFLQQLTDRPMPDRHDMVRRAKVGATHHKAYHEDGGPDEVLRGEGLLEVREAEHQG
ncbi:unnamed protein product, partial [Ectocarpus sp. 8 AP-2014]